MEFKAGYSKLYAVFRMWLVLTTQLFYRRVYYKGVKNIPEGAGLIFAPNHQSAFMDAMMASQMLKTQNRYLVRADIFKNPLAKKLLTGFNLLPIYRIRDGVDSMDKNEQIFKTSEDAILRKESMIIFPEGNQADSWRLRPLKKGYARIAFGALKRAPKEVPLYIIPTGINYYNFTDYRGELVIEYGEAINIRDFEMSLKESEAKAINELRDRLSKQMSPLMFDIRDRDHYHDIKEVSHLLSPMNEELSTDFEYRKKFFSACGKLGQKTEVKTKAIALAEYLRKSKVAAQDLRMAKNGELLFLLKPIFWLIAMASKLINAPLMSPIEWFINNKVKDHHFHASLRFVLCNFLFPVYYGIVLLVTFFVFNWGIAVITISGMGVLSYAGILVKDKLKYHSKRRKIKNTVQSFDDFNNSVLAQVAQIKSLMA